MFLKSLSIKGFKSFADATTLVMEPGVTVVVGPNGSGKSNVVDAIGWVLGWIAFLGSPTYRRRFAANARAAGLRVGEVMGAVAAARSDLVIVTDDNPRGEDPAAIRRDVLQGAPDAREIGDRRAAIRAAISQAGANDIVLIAGKGHEQGQIVGSGEAMRVLPFDDVAVARECAGELSGVRH